MPIPHHNHTSIPSGEDTDDERTSRRIDPTIFRKGIPSPDSVDVQPEDAKYISFYLKEGPGYFGSPCFVGEMLDIFTFSFSQPVLRHSILALSSMVQPLRSEIEDQARTYALRNLRHVIPEIQTAITKVKITTAHLISVTFLIYYSIATHELRKAHTHVRGLFAMLKKSNLVSNDGTPIQSPPDPVLAFVYLLGIKADNILADRNQPYAFPLLRFDENFFRKWLTNTHRSEYDLQICLASIHLAFLCNNVGHLRNDTVQPRVQGGKEIESIIAERTEIIRKKHQSWLLRPYIQRHIQATTNAPYNPSSNPTQRFLKYPPYQIFDPAVARMHFVHASLQIQLAIAQHGTIEGFNDQVFDAAVLICRIFAVVSTGPVNLWLDLILTPLWLTGVVFGDKRRPYWEGLQWLGPMLVSVDKGGTFSSAAKIREALFEYIQSGDDPWDTLGGKFK